MTDPRFHSDDAPHSGVSAGASAGWQTAYVHSTSDALLAIDVVTGRIVGGNPALWRLLGYDAAVLTGTHFSALLPPSTSNPNTPVERRFPITGAVSEDELFRHADGSDIACDVLVTAVRDPQAELAILHLRDARARAAAHDSRLAGDRAALDAERSEGVVRAVEQYMSHVSHELRTPLAVILSSSSMLERYYARLSDAKRDEHFSRIQTQVKYLTEFLDNLRFLSRLNAGHVDVRRDATDVSTLLGEMLSEFSADPQQPRFETHLDGALDAIAIDAALWRRALLPLIGNAVKYGPPGGSVRITLSGTAETLETRVSDAGPGLPADYLAQPFEVFRRGEAARDVHGGGLGLAIAYRCAALMGGSLNFDTRDGAGTTFTLIVPLNADAKG